MKTRLKAIKALVIGVPLCAPLLASAGTSEPVVWTDQRNATSSGPAGAGLSKTGTPGWNAGAMSTRAIASGDGYVEFTVDQTNTTRGIGLSHRERAERVLWTNLVGV